MRWQRKTSVLSLLRPIEKRNRPKQRVLLHLESLEDRSLLNANPLLATNPNVSVLADNQAAVGEAHPTFEIIRPTPQSLSQPADGQGPSAGGPSPDYTPSQSPGGYWPSQLSQAYGFNKLSLDGTGQTIAIVDAYADPNMASDLAAFDAQFNLSAPPSFLQYDENGNLNPSGVPTDSTGGWEVEETLDVEWAHAIAPKANIILVEANSASISDLLTAVNFARNFSGGTINGVSVAPTSVVSMSWGGSESSSDSGYDSYFTTPTGHTGVTFVASSGDNGAPSGYPALSPNVLAVGGTTLALDSSDNRSSEVGWSGSGGGPSSSESQPGYQSTYAQSSYVQNTLGNTVLLNSTRGNPDVSYVADPNPGVAIYDTFANQYSINGWGAIGGTSDAAPQWAALIALVDQGRGAAGSLDGATQTLPALYQLGTNPTSYANDFFDVTSGNNGYSAGTGYDFVTGLGSPRADHLVPALIGNQGPVSFSVTTSSSAPVAGTPFSVTVTALDDSGHTFTGYTGTVQFTTSDTGAAVTLPSDYTFTTADNGVHTFTNVTLVTAGTQTVTVTDTTNSSLTGQASVNVGAAAAVSTLSVSAPASVAEDSPFTLTVTAKDPYGNTATSYRGMVHFTTSDTGTGVVLPSNYLFTAADNGVHTFSNGVTLVTVGAQTVTATDTTNSGLTGQAAVNVTPPPATHFLVSAPASSTAGTAFSITVTALDAHNDTVPSYLGTVHFTTSDSGTGVVLPANYTFTAADNGVHTFTNVTLVTAGTRTVTITDTTNSSLTGQASVNVGAAAAVSTLSVSAPASVTLSFPFTLTVTAKDPYGNTAASYRGTVHFTTSDTGTGVVLPANYTFTAADNGVHTFTNGVTLVTAGTQTVTATDTTTSSITGQASVSVTKVPTGNLIVNGGFETGNFSGWTLAPASVSSYFGVSATYPHSGSDSAFFGAYTPPYGDYIYQEVPTIAGHTYQISYWVANGSPTPAGDAEIRSSWGGTVLEDLHPTSAFAYQQHTFNVVANSASTEFRIGGNQVENYWYLDDVSVTDTTAPATAPASLSVTASTGAPVAGTPFSVTVTALDASGHTFTGYTGTVHFTTTDSGAAVTLPSNYTFTAADNGVHTFTNVTLVTAGTRTVTVTDTTNSSLTAQASVNVGAAAASTLTVSAPASVAEDSPFTLTVTAKDPYGNAATGYGGTVHFTTGDTGTGVVLPANYTFTAADNGVHTFTNVTLVTAGTQTVTATDTTTSSITGHTGVYVTPPQATHFLVSAPASSTAGTAFSITVTALDVNNKTVTGYLGSIHFTTSDSGTGVVLPANYTFTAADNGVHTFTNATLVTAGTRTVTITDTTNSSLTGQASVNVGAAAASTLTVSAPASVTLSFPFTLTVTAKDPYGNTAASYRGTVHFTTSDTGTGVVLPANYTFTAADNGVHTFSNGVTLVTAGTQTVTATDTTTSSITGQASVSVTKVPTGNLIVNGGFETGNFSGWTLAPAAVSSYFGVSATYPHSGSDSAFFGAYTPPYGDYIYQEVPTIAGHTYQISYWVANGSPTPAGDAEIRSSWGGTVLEDLHPTSAFAYQQHTFNVVANSASTEFRIGGNQVENYWYLDDVSVTDTTAAAASRLGTGAAIPNSSNVNGGNNIGAFEVHQGDSSPVGTMPFLAQPLGLDAVSLLPALSPSWTTLFLNSTPGSALSTGTLPGQEVAAVDRLFAWLYQWNAAFGLSAATLHAPTEVNSWPLDPL